MNPNDPYTPPEQPQQPILPVQPEQPQPAYVPPQAPQSEPSSTPTEAHDPGKGLGIAGFILAFFFPLVGLILSIIGFVKSKKAGYKNGLALAGIILNSVFMVVAVLFITITIMAYSGIQERANAQSALTKAETITKMAEMYNAENGDATTPKYPKNFSDISSMVENVTLVKTPILFAPTDPNSIEFYACGDQTGNKVGYWDSSVRDVKYMYAGDASDSSTDCTLVTQ